MEDVKYVLYYTEMLGNFYFNFKKIGFDLFAKCKVNNCYATNNRNLLPIDKFAALFFYIPVSKKYKNYTKPEKRNPRQRYVFVNLEAPARFYGGSVRFLYDDFFNWTMTYRFDSDLIKRSGGVYKRIIPKKYAFKGFSNKTRSVAWVVSNCNTPSKRENLAKKLRNYIDVDIYGDCGNKNCPEDCFGMIEKNYKFYLSFENSYCNDYTTEKLYNILQRNIIPVVYGGGNYQTIAPPNSVINVEDYDRVEDLAQYLNFLAKNETEYLKYFEWKSYYSVARTGMMNRMTLCALCAKLNNPDEPQKTYHDIKSWWYESQCKTNEDLPKIIKNSL